MAVIAVFALAVPAFAADYTLFDDASLVTGGNPDNAIQIVSDSTPGWGGVSFSVPTGLTFAELSTLSTDYNVTDDDCVGGSPRFQIKVNTGSELKNIFVYIGPEPSYTGCTPNTWVNTGNLLDASRKIDTSQLGGAFYDTYANALANFGTYPVVGISLVTDGGWASPDSEQTILVDNVAINSDVYTFDPVLVGPPTNKDDCKKDGWMTFNNPTFKNQGACVSYVVSNENAGKRN